MTEALNPPENYRHAPGSPSGVEPVISALERERIGPGPWQHGGTYARRATGIALRIIESVLRSNITVEGTQNLGRGPILFVANHFTRFETFILPYLIDRYAHRNVHSLAHWGLFVGRFGAYLRSIGAMSTKDPEVKHAIVEELIRGTNDWVIYPEGSMIKDKMVWQKGRFALSSPDRIGPPHTGSAVLALQAEIYRELYLDACRRGDVNKRAEYEQRFHLDYDQLPSQQLSIVPINISYYPIRPSKNLFYRLARFFLKDLPSRLEDELMIEGSLLLDKTDISIYFGKPMSLDRYRELLWPALNALGGMEEEQKVRTIIDDFKVILTDRMMTEIYTRLTVNFDHLFCSGIRQLARDRIGVEEFHLALFLAARGLQSSGSRRRHRSLAGRMQMIIGDEEYEPLTSIRSLAESESMLSVEEGSYLVDHQALESRHDFHDIRLKNTLAVIANELEPLREVVKNVRELVNMSRSVLRERTVKLLMQEDQDLYQAEYDACQATPHRKDPATGRPFLLRGRSRLGILLSHGYLASPGEVRELAVSLNRLGYTVYVVRLQGHGTSPEHLHTVSWTDWLESYDRGYCILRHSCEKVLLAGFSSGALLAMAAAARKGEAPAGLVAINPALRLQAKTASLAPVVDGWNRLLETFHIQRGHFDFVENHPEWPTTNYDRNYVHGLFELEKLIGEVVKTLPAVTVPTLIVQGDHDPVVDATGAPFAMKLISSARKEQALMQFDRHCIVQGAGSEQVFARVAEFVDSIEASLGRHHPGRKH